MVLAIDGSTLFEWMDLQHFEANMQWFFLCLTLLALMFVAVLVWRLELRFKKFDIRLKELEAKFLSKADGGSA